MREVLNESAERRIAVLDPLRLIIDNYPEGQGEECLAPNHPLKPELGKRAVPFGKELWIEREDFMEEPSQGLPPPLSRQHGAAALRLRRRMHRLRQGCQRQGQSPCTANTCPTPRSGTPGADSYKVKGNLHWVSVAARLCRRGAPLRPPVPARPRRAPASAISSPTSIRIRGRSSPPSSNRRCRKRAPRSASSSSGTATSSPTASIRKPARRSSTAR